MRKVDLLIFRAVFPPFIITLTVLTSVVFIGKIGNWAEIFISNDVAVNTVGIICVAILPTILIFSMPLSFLIGILIGITGLKGESQITALRACGIPIRRLLMFILCLGIAIGIITLALSLTLVPRTNSYLRAIKETILLSQAPLEFQPRVFNEEIPDKVFYIEDTTADRKKWFRVFMASDTDSKNPSITLAKSVDWTSLDNSPNQRLQLHFEKGSRYTIDLNNPGDDQVFQFTSVDIPIELNQSGHDSIQQPSSENPRKVAEMNSLELWNYIQNPKSDHYIKAFVELNQRIALPFSVFPFAILGISLAVGSPKAGRTGGFALSLVVVLLFYILFVNGIRLAKIGEINAWVGPWAANLILGCLGLLLLLIIERKYLSASWLPVNRLKHLWWHYCKKFHLYRIQSVFSWVDSSFARTTGSFFRFFFPKVIDLYIAKGFLGYFLWSLITCSFLFMLLTLFELLDDVIRNGTPVIQVVEYFTFLVPQVLMMAIPMSVLLGILINFGILEKNSEVTAMKAGGWSLYRLSIPIVLITTGFCVCLFLVQDYILPTSNERQDMIWSSIKGRPQTSRMKRKWILGESGRIYNYEHFDENQDSFIGLNIYETDLNSAEITGIIRASRAQIIQDGSWILQNGWIREYDSQDYPFRRFQKEIFRFPEKSDYFEKEIFQPTESSKMTYHELMSHIKYLMKSGYNAIELQVELKKKIAFPFSCIVMALLAIPFSFIVGKRGAFFGIGASIAFAILYLMISGLFESMGTYGILTPFLAAWAPNILFGAAGCWMLLSIRT